MCCYANNTYLSPGMKWEAGSGIASLYTHALNHYEPREEGKKERIKFSQAFLDRSVICLCSVEACLYVCAPVGRDDCWPLAGVRCGLSQKPCTTESIFCEIRMKNISELLQLSDYRSKNRLGGLLPLCLFLLPCMWKRKTDEWGRQTNKQTKKKMTVCSSSKLHEWISTSYLCYIMHVLIPAALY